MANAKTEHSRKLRRQSARESLARAIAEGRIKRKMLQAPTEIMDAFLVHMAATGGRTDAEKLSIINEMLNNLQGAKNNS